MAALTATSGSVVKDVWGKHRVTMAALANIADADTWVVPGMTRIVKVIGIVPVNASTVAADKVAVASYTGNTITFQCVGTQANNDVEITVAGI